jgi:hypothetical protein
MVSESPGRDPIRCPSRVDRGRVYDRARKIDLRKKIVATVIVCGWIVYIGTTAYVAWRLFRGDTPLFLKDYTLGTNAAWVTVGVMLWVATEWFRDGGD